MENPSFQVPRALRKIRAFTPGDRAASDRPRLARRLLSCGAVTIAAAMLCAAEDKPADKPASTEKKKGTKKKGEHKKKEGDAAKDAPAKK